MERAFPGFKKSLKENFEIKPLFAEDLLATKKGGIKKVCRYYSVPRGGKEWPVDKIRELLSAQESIGELLNI